MGDCERCEYETNCETPLSRCVKRPHPLVNLLPAAENMDWQQVVFNSGPPCFHLGENGRFCGRAERWHNEDTHKYVSLADLLKSACR